MDDTSCKPLRVMWQGPHTIEAGRALNGDGDYGLYQIYGRHVVFGAGALLYVGRAINQTFGARLSQHAPWLQHEQDVLVHVGRLNETDYPVEPEPWPTWDALVRDAEAFTIWWHSPPYNSANIARFTCVARAHLEHGVWLQHHGARGSLDAEHTNRWAPTVARPPDETDAV